MPNIQWTDQGLRPTRLTIEPGIKPGLYKFSVDDFDISQLIDFADILFFNRREFLPGKITVNTAVDLPEEIKVTLFTGEKTNGSNR